MNDWNVNVIGALGTVIIGLLGVITRMLMNRRKSKREDRAADADNAIKLDKAAEKKFENALTGMRSLAAEFERLLKEALVKIDKMQDDRLEDLEHRVRCEAKLQFLEAQMSEMMGKKTSEAKGNGDDLQSADR